jgi:hypothetical protein
MGVNITFEGAIQQTQDLLSQIESLDAGKVTQEIADLVSTENGARGFFVTYLTSNDDYTKFPTPEVIQALKSAPTVVEEVLVKTLAMSTAMALTHRSNDDEENAQDSERVSQKTGHLIQKILSPTLTEKIQQLSISLNTGEGTYQAFLERWNYDHSQRQAIAEVIQPFLH